MDTDNFLPWSGTKNYLGYNKSSSGNWFVFSDYSPAALSHRAANDTLRNGWNACAMSYGTWAMGPLSDRWFNNTCIAQDSKRFFSFNGCNSATPMDGGIPLFAANRYASQDGGYTMGCGKESWGLAQAQAAGVDVGSVLVPLPSAAELVAAAKALCGFT